METKAKLRETFERYKAGNCSLEEISFLMGHFGTENREFLDALVLQEFEALEQEQEELPPLPARIYEGIEARIQATPAKRIKLWAGMGWKISAAAAVAALTFGIWFYNSSTSTIPETEFAIQNDIAPGKNRATLTLANGKTINLSDAKTGVIIGGSKLTYNDGSLVRYSSGSHFSGSAKADQKNTGPVGVTSLGVQVLTASTPRGGTYQIVLPDGSKVWLNAASTIKFPSTFSGLVSRSVELTGEAYFEIFRNKKQPFVVNSKKLELTVLGTHFNVNAYEDEKSTKATLLEGSVKVASLSLSPPGRGAEGVVQKGVILKPGEQAATGNSGIRVKAVHVNDVVDWKNGDFVFKNEDFRTVMRKVARWYDVEIVYDKTAPADIPLGGLVSRSKNISSILKIMEATGDVHFKIEGRRITVSR